MSARGRLLSGLVTAVVALAGFVGLGALPAAASPPTIQYVALGDSYAAGQGGGSYLNGCLQTAASYPELLNVESRIQLQANPTCSGAKTSDVAAQLTELTENTRLVTLTVGAADLGLSRVLTTCTTGTQEACLVEIARARGELEKLGSNLTFLYAEVADAAPKARIVVTGYPQLLEPTAPFDPVLIAAVNAATGALNSTIEQAVSFTNATDVNIHYVDVTEEFAGHGIVTLITDPEDPNAFIHSLFTCDPPRPDCPDFDAFHPTVAGYRAYADAISAALPGGWLDKQKQSV